LETSQGENEADPITVEEALDLSDDSCFNVLTKKEAEIAASLEYDPKENFLRKKKRIKLTPSAPEIVEPINNVRDPFRMLKD
jgi:hypothetical protein